jgi:hypothetical protein
MGFASHQAPKPRGASLTICTLPQRSHSMRRNHEGNALNRSSIASAPDGSGSVPSLRQYRLGGVLAVMTALCG